MSRYKITLPGLEGAANELNKSLFDNLSLPDGIDKEVLTDNIIIQSGSYEVLYSDIDFMRYAIGAWSRKNYRTFEKWITALNIEYNPLENYDRMEEWTDKGKLNKTTDDDISSSGASSGSTTGELDQTTTDHGTDIGDSTDENKRASFNNPTYQNYEQTINDHSNTLDNRSVIDNDTYESRADEFENSSERDIKESQTTEDIRTGRAHGNIGVTTSQQMLESELDIARWNIYDKITDLFMTEFIIMIFD